ncbi:MAG: hypothetical protein E7350_01605 [Clostridiales bacterium]|nr:hypothetical protein [Clostridiales bacterium]
MKLPLEFLEEMQSIVPDYERFVRSYDLPHTKAFWVNGNKITDKKLLLRMGQYAPVPFADHSYYMDSEEKWGNHPFHHAGLMYFQEPSAMAVANAYDAHASLALDMCAAPGGKTVHLAHKVDFLISNEINPSRAAVLKSNVERLGFKNVAVTNHSPLELEALGEIFDLVLVDAPCSGEGMFRKDEGAIVEWSKEHSVSCAIRQLAILDSAHKVLKRGGMLIYSTCTFSPRENEGVIEEFLSKYDYEIVAPLPSVLPHTAHYTDSRMRRFYPHIGVGEGQFFVALTKKEGGLGASFKPIKYAKSKNVDEFLMSTIGKRLDYCENNGMFFVPALKNNLPLKRIVSGGVKIGRMEGKIFKPDHHFFSAFGNEMFCYEPSEDELKRYIHGEELLGEHKGYGAITVLGAPLGGFKGSDGRYKNLYPKGLRL